MAVKQHGVAVEDKKEYFAIKEQVIKLIVL